MAVVLYSKQDTKWKTVYPVQELSSLFEGKKLKQEFSPIFVIITIRYRYDKTDESQTLKLARHLASAAQTEDPKAWREGHQLGLLPLDGAKVNVRVWDFSFPTPNCGLPYRRPLFEKAICQSVSPFL